jgi:alkanesulfonate monooxygenase SsuD/methylene tetrahydromethanopterin reductase-like flavin-dependent oxidoreductase (luciferase family)
MELGIFFQGYVPGFRREHDPDAEHHAFMDEIECVLAAERAGFKYVWITEHHFLDEYSHLSANDVVAGYLAHATSRIHIGSGIFNPLPQVNHPAKLAERVAMLDHLTEGRFEFGTGRGAGSHEILGFLPDIEDMDETRAIWEETIGELPKMWLQDTYEGFQGKYWSLPPRKVLPKPYVKPHPPMWYAAGNISSWEMAGRKGLGVLGFGAQTYAAFEKAHEPYQQAIASAEPIGAFVNDHVMVCINAFVDEDGDAARRGLIESRPNYLTSNVFRYHDTFPAPPHVPKWPAVIPDYTPDDVAMVVELGSTICGDPDEALAQCQRWVDAGLDQLTFGIGTATKERTLETIRLMGEHVIPKIDLDPVHRTTHFRDSAR